MTIRAAVMPGPGKPVEIREFPDLELEPNSASMRTTLADVCGTDVHLRAGKLAGVPYPIIPGHVSVGTIDTVRGELRDIDDRPVREGDLVTFYDVTETCNECHACLVAKAATRCPSRKVYGITYGVEDGMLGGFCETLYLRPGVRVLPLEGVDAKTAVAAGCGLPTAYHSVERAGIEPGDTVLVQGCGPVGIQAVAIAKSFGAERVLVTGAPATRLQIAAQFGADETFDITKTSVDERAERIAELTHGRGVDRVIEVAGHTSAIPEALHLVRDSGVVVVAGHYTDAGEVAINPHLDINKKHLDIRGCWGSEFRHFHRAFRWLAHTGKSLPYGAMISKVYPLECANDALDDVQGLRVVKAVIDPWAIA